MKDIVSLRNHLFEQLNRLADAQGDELTQEVQKAASIVQVSETIIKSAEVENQFIAITKSIGSGFVPVVNTGKPKSLISHIEDAAQSQDKVGSDFNVNAKEDWLTDNSKK